MYPPGCSDKSVSNNYIADSSPRFFMVRFFILLGEGPSMGKNYVFNLSALNSELRSFPTKVGPVVGGGFHNYTIATKLFAVQYTLFE